MHHQRHCYLPSFACYMVIELFLIMSTKEVIFLVPFVCLLAVLLKKLWTDFEKIFRKARQYHMEQSVKFWWWFESPCWLSIWKSSHYSTNHEQILMKFEFSCLPMFQVYPYVCTQTPVGKLKLPSAVPRLTALWPCIWFGSMLIVRHMTSFVTLDFQVSLNNNQIILTP